MLESSRALLCLCSFFSFFLFDHSFFSSHSCHQAILLIDHSHSPSSSESFIFVRRSIIFVARTLGVPASNRGVVVAVWYSCSPPTIFISRISYESKEVVPKDIEP
ncbi:hypothetical protein V8G54_029264 [Vigna mungo]|uniref:Secreted protein n=1 Tax=Vigna mungo TaxID=3915 RepID=A0AAQ3RJ12_VIGMU